MIAVVIDGLGHRVYQQHPVSRGLLTVAEPPILSHEAMPHSPLTRLRNQRHQRVPRILLSLIGTIVIFYAGDAAAQSLRGSRSSLDRQNREARGHDFTYVRGPSQLTRLVGAGLLVPVEGNADYSLADVSYPVARPEVQLFIERLSGQYREACGVPLVVTSLTRPRSSQPPNASSRSVHPTGMALDLRRPATRACRRWLESTLLYLERKGVLDATLERRPPHYHVAVFPDDYIAYVATVTGRDIADVMVEAEGADS